MATRHPTPTRHLFKDVSGQRSGHLLALRYHGYIGKDRAWWCRCDCGRELVVKGSDIRRQTIKSCGFQCPHFTENHHRKHGMYLSPEYKAWRSMRDRCHRKTSHRYALYGAIGRKVCRGMRESFDHFYAVLGPKPTRRASLDRIKNERGYDCGQCDDCRERGAELNIRWASFTVQNQNRRGVRLVTFRGETHCVAEWSRRTGLSAVLIGLRIRRGWTAEEALTLTSEEGPKRRFIRRTPRPGTQKAAGPA